MSNTDAQYTGSIPANYDRVLGPMLFQPFADNMAPRVAALSPQAVLETAAGTGIVTLRLAGCLPTTTRIVGTDLNQVMIDAAAAKPASDHLASQRRDAIALRGRRVRLCRLPVRGDVLPLAACRLS